MNPTRFSPPLYLTNGWVQTLAAHFLRSPRTYPGEIYHQIPLPDGDKLVVVENNPRENFSNKSVVMVHGLTGCYESSYMTRISHKLNQVGIKTFRVNLRGCGPGFGLAKNFYHAGRSEDILEVLKWLKKRDAKSSTSLLGFSLGANICLKLGGELQEKGKEFLEKITAVSSPIDLSSTVDHLGKNKFFDKYFVKLLIKELYKRERFQPGFTLSQRPTEKMSIRDIDDIYTAPMSGLTNAETYYSYASSQNYLEKIQIPTLMIAAEDDPIVQVSDYRKIPQSSMIEKLITQKGGHVGFIQRQGLTHNFWIDSIIHDFISS